MTLRTTTILFLVLSATPARLTAQTIDSVHPAVADRSERIEIHGSGFGSERGTVSVGGFEAQLVVWNEAEVVAHVPERTALGEMVLTLRTAGGQSASAPLEVEPRTSAGRIRWRFAVEGDYMLHPPGAGSVGSNVYISDLGGRLYAVDAGGGLLWIVDALRGQQGGGTEGPVVTGPDGTTYVAVNPLGQDVDLVAVSPEGEIRWVFTDAGAWSFAAGPGIGPHGNVYAVFQDPVGSSVGVVSMTPQGTLRWSNGGAPPIYEHGGIGAEMAFGPSLPGGATDRLFLTVDNNDNRMVYAFNLDDGSQAWAVPAAVNDVFEGQSAVAASPAGLVYLTERNGHSLQAFSSLDGHRVWRYSPGIAANATNPAVGPDGSGYIGWDGGHLGAVGPDGRERWQHFASDGSIACSPRVTPHDEYVLINGWQGPPELESGWVKGIDTSTGELAWQANFESGAPDLYLLPRTPMRITEDGRRAYAPVLASGFNPDPAYAYIYALAIDGIEAAISPDASVVQPGGSLGYSLEVQNFETHPKTLDVWVSLTGPEGGLTQTVFGPMRVTLDSGERYASLPRLNVTPLTFAAQGPHTVRLLAGKYPKGPEASAQFELWLEPLAPTDRSTSQVR